MKSLNNRENELDRGPIFIVGMPRSGTTLLRSMLSVHPQIVVSRETHFLPKWWKRYRHLDLNNIDNFEAFWEDFSASDRFPKVVADPPLVKEQILASNQIDLKTIFTSIMQVLASTMNKPRWVEKTPTHYKYLHLLLDWYPQARIIWMLRDPRAVVTSTIDRWHNKTVEDCAAKWSESVLSFQEQWSEDERVQIVKYEELVLNTELQMRKLCDFLGEEFFPEMLGDRTKIAERVILSDAGPNKGANRLANQSPTSERIDRWRSQLSPAQIAMVEGISKEAMLRCNYQLSVAG
jgi:hypothetical protein